MKETILQCPLETLDLKQAAHFLRLGYEAMKALVEAGEVPALRLNQKDTVLLRDDLIAYVREEGRRQAEQRKREARPPSTIAASSQPPRRKRRALIDLDRYEQIV